MPGPGQGRFMDAVVTGVLSSLIVKLGNVLVGEYKLQTGVNGEIMFLRPELESMQIAVEEIASVPPDQVDSQDKSWASEVRELCYDIEDSIDTFTVRYNDDSEPLAGPRGMKTFMERSMDLLTRFRNRRKLATDIRGIKRRLVEVRKRRKTYKLGGVVDKPATVDPRLLAHYTKVAELVGIDDRRDELIKFLEEGDDEVSMMTGKIVSIVEFGGLGKTALANAVYVKIKAQFDCCAFVSVSQTPDMKKLFNNLLRDLGKRRKEEYTLDEKWLIDELRAFLEDKRYLIIIDDIWGISTWKMIRCALPDNKSGYRIITTTRIYDVAKQVGSVYQMKPLCPHNSKILLYSRIFGGEHKGNNDKCLDEQLVEVSDKILRKCAGVPLAIITMAGLLANKGRNKMEWFEVCKSIGDGLDNSLDMENMRKILSFSYYDLPPYLRKCLLYLSVFPEDYEIDKDRLIRMWAAEEFIECEIQGKSLFEVGESYFNELINKSMIQPVYLDDEEYSSMIVSCRIHDMVLDLIRSLSNEQNLVTISIDVDQRSRSKKVIRRLCFHNSQEEHVSTETTMTMQQVRSVVVFPSAINLLPALWSFTVLRVLDLQDCNLLEAYNLEYLGNLFHLRYLGLGGTKIAKLSGEIGNLEFLQTLDISFNPIISLPATIVELRHLTSLLLPGYNTSLPNGVERLKSLEELYSLDIKDTGSARIIEELGNLKKLRVLEMSWTTEMNSSLERSMVQCLNKLRKLQRLSIFTVDIECNLNGWVAPPHLSRLELGQWFSTLPNWMNPSLGLLWFLHISVRELRQEDLQTLGRLPALQYLYLGVDHENLGITRRFTVGSCSFPCLVQCQLWQFGGPMEFRRSAMPKLTDLRYSLPVREARGIDGSDGDLDFGLGNLRSLQSLVVSLISEGASEEVGAVKAAVRHAMEIHPNRPSLDVSVDGKKGALIRVIDYSCFSPCSRFF
ncbi:hypothetical protein U9M48_004494 [Paspalum notatum var. saurae]|uniref:Uncharacterized protein n=1 Tax=Paspalum notatum var. saurae TaxID=547442 RepID=A0AAQ3PMS2_PASNO